MRPSPASTQRTHGLRSRGRCGTGIGTRAASLSAVCGGMWARRICESLDPRASEVLADTDPTERARDVHRPSRAVLGPSSLAVGCGYYRSAAIALFAWMSGLLRRFKWHSVEQTASPCSIRRLRAPGRRHSGTRRHRRKWFAIVFTTDEAATTREVAHRPPPVDHRRDQGRRDADLGGG